MTKNIEMQGKELAMRKLERVCRENENIISYTICYNDFYPYICCGDVLFFDRNKKPEQGDYVLIKCKDKIQLIQIVGKSIMGNYIIITRHHPYPIAKEILSINLYGVMVNHIKNSGENLGKMVRDFPQQ